MADARTGLARPDQAKERHQRKGDVFVASIAKPQILIIIALRHCDFGVQVMTEPAGDTHLTPKRRRGTAVFGLIALLVLAIWIANVLFSIFFPWPKSLGRAEFGDSLNVASSLCAALALIGVAYSIMLQREERDALRDELLASKDISKRQEENIDAQNAAVRRQQFDNTFFQLFSAFNDIAMSMHVTIKRQTKQVNLLGHVSGFGSIQDISASGRDAFTLLVEDIEKRYEVTRFQKARAMAPDFPATSEDFEKLNKIEREFPRRHDESFREAYDEFFKAHGDDLGRYFRSLYTMLNFVWRSQLSFEDMNFYFKLIRSQLSRDESTMLAINSMTKYSTAKFNGLVRVWGMAKNADRDNGLLETFILSIHPSIYGLDYGMLSIRHVPYQPVEPIYPSDEGVWNSIQLRMIEISPLGGDHSPTQSSDTPSGLSATI